jgi:hypothetical protein
MAGPVGQMPKTGRLQGPDTAFRVFHVKHSGRFRSF